MWCWIAVLSIFWIQFFYVNPSDSGISCYRKSRHFADSSDTCIGWCVLKTLIYENGTTEEVSGCQPNSEYLMEGPFNKGQPFNKSLVPTDETYRPRFRNNKCYGMKDVQALHYNLTRNGIKIRVKKVCCNTPYCNEMDKLEEPLRHYEQRKYDPTESIFCVVLSMLIILVCTIMPMVGLFKMLVWRSGLTDEDYIQIIDPHLITSTTEEFKVVDTNITVKGQMNIEETANVLLEMIEGSDVSSVTSSTTDAQVIFNTPQMVTAGGNGHALVRATLIRPFYLKSPLFRMIEHGPAEYPFKADELLEIFDEAKNVFFSDPPLIHIQHSVVIFGDLRGAYADLHRWLQTVGWPPRTRLLFLGNLIDKNEPGSIETLALVCCLKIAFPQEVFVLRGSCEATTYVPAGRYNHKIADALGGCITRLCSFLPTAAIIMDKIFAVPSGISPLLKSPSDVKDLDRPVSLEEMKLIQTHLMFSRPFTRVRMFRPKERSRGDYFGLTAVERIREQLGVSVIVRCSAPVPYGYLPSWNHTLITVWSAPGKETQMGAVLVVTDKAEITPLLMKAQTEPTKYTENETATSKMNTITTVSTMNEVTRTS